MRERGKITKPQSLAGSLLLAHPSLRDPNFRRTVILMSVHNAEGAMGVVLNRPTSRRLGEVNDEFSVGPLASVPVFEGGPVETQQVILAAWQAHEDGFKLYFGIEPDKAGQLVSEEGAHVRAFLGYSGWTGGQLEGELKQQTWVITSVPGDLMDHPEGDGLWRAVLGSIGDEWKLLAHEPEDPTRN